MSISSNHQENIPPPVLSHSKSTISERLFTKVRSFAFLILIVLLGNKTVDDDTEVANSFSTDKSPPFAVPRPPRSRPSLVSQFEKLSRFLFENLLDSSRRNVLLKRI